MSSTVAKHLRPVLTLCALSLSACAREDEGLDSAEPGWTGPTLAFRRMEYSDEGLRVWFDGEAREDFELRADDGALLARQTARDEDSLLFEVRDPASLIDLPGLYLSSPESKFTHRFDVLWSCEPSAGGGYACAVSFEANPARGDAMTVHNVSRLTTAINRDGLLAASDAATLGDFLHVVGRLESADAGSGCSCAWARSIRYDPSAVSLASHRDGSAYSSGMLGVGPGATAVSRVQAAAGEASQVTELMLEGSVDAELSLICYGELSWEATPVVFSVGEASAVSAQVRKIPYHVEPCADCEARIDVLTGISGGVSARVNAGKPSILSCSGSWSEVVGGPTLEYFPDLTSPSSGWVQATDWATANDLSQLALSQSAFALTQAAGRDGDRATVQARAGATFAVYGESNCGAPTSFYSARSISGRPAVMQAFYAARGFSTQGQLGGGGGRIYGPAEATRTVEIKASPGSGP